LQRSRGALPGGSFNPLSRPAAEDYVSDWQIWVVLAALLLVAEMFAPGFWLASLAVGCLAAGLAALLPLGLLGEILVFAGTTVGSLFGLRPVLVRRFLHARGMEVRTNVEALVGKSGVVVQRFDPVTRLGRVKVEGEDWRSALVEGGTPLEPGTRIMVVQVDGSTLVVEKEAGDS
jgi:membrane protein implicated in regulation of membrane protease activity